MFLKLKYLILVVVILLGVLCFTIMGGNSGGTATTSQSTTQVEANANHIEEPTISVQYTPYSVPNINSYFKTYMDYRTVTNKQSNQYKFIHTWGWCDNQGFMRCTGERVLGIDDDYYLIALGSYYGTDVGTKYRITTDTGNVFYGVLADCKADIHTNSTNQYVPFNNNIVEFLVDTRVLNKDVKYHGSANVYMPLNGNIAKIERIDFICE